MWHDMKRWLTNIPQKDPVMLRLAPFIQLMMIAQIIASVIMLAITLATTATDPNTPLNVCVLLIMIGGNLCGLWLYRHEYTKTASWLVIGALLFATGVNALEWGLDYAAETLSSLILPIIMAGFLAGRRGLLVTVPATILIVISMVLLDIARLDTIQFYRPSPIFTIITFALIACLAGFFLDQFVSTLHSVFNDMLTRQQELTQIRQSLEAHTQELSQAKEELEQELKERHRLEQALVYERDLLHTLMDNSPDMIYFKDTESRFIRINRAKAALLGLDNPEQAVGKTDFDFKNDELSQNSFNEERQIIATRQPLIDRIEYNPTPDGQPRWLSATKAPIIDQNGRVTGIIGISRDVTARQEVEDMKNQFISIVSHELRTPLTSIRGSLGLLIGEAAGQLPPTAHSMLSIALRNTDRLLSLINDLLDIERIEAGRLVMNMQPTELTNLIEQTIEANAAYGTQYKVTFELTHRVPNAIVHADPDRLMQVFTNLLSNAAKFSPPNSVVEIGVKHLPNDNYRIWITDHGSGIPKAFYRHIFEKFAQADASDSRQKGGTGLGLSITKAIVEQLGGTISFSSQLNQGTTFYVDLPAWHSEQERHHAV